MPSYFFPNNSARVFSHQLAAGVLDYFAVLGVTSTHSRTIKIICQAHRIAARHVVDRGILRTRLSNAININTMIPTSSFWQHVDQLVKSAPL